jgi:hypothetical protein
MHDGDINVRHRSVVREAAAVPIATVVAAARIAEAVIDAAIKTDMVAPIAPVPAVASTGKIPKGRCP